MGRDVRLVLEIPIQFITVKRFNDKKMIRQSELQNLRLWQRGRHQYIMFFANLTTEKHKEINGQYALYFMTSQQRLT